MKNLISKFIHLPYKEKQLFFSAIKIALYTRILIWIMPSQKIIKMAGTIHSESPFELNYNEDDKILPIIRGMKRASRYLPFREKCLVDCLVAKKMLGKINISTTIYFGLSKNDEAGFIAHSWLRYGNRIITGEKGMERFVVVEWAS